MKLKRGFSLIRFLLIVIAVALFIFFGYKEVTKIKDKHISEDNELITLQMKVNVKLINEEVHAKKKDKLVGTPASELPEDFRDREKIIEKLKELKVEEKDYKNYYVIGKEDYKDFKMEDKFKNLDKIFLVDYAKGEIYEIG